VKLRKFSRPIDCSDEQGCWLDETECTSPNISIQESVSFPVSIIDDRLVNSCVIACKFLAFGVFLIAILVVRNYG